MILEDTFVVNVQVALFSADNVLLIKRSETEIHAPGAIDLPGGKLELTEVGDNALEKVGARELLEETGVNVQGNLRYVCSALFIASDGSPVLNVVLAARHLNERPVPHPGIEELEAFWAPVPWAFDFPGVPSWTRDYIKKSLDSLRSPDD